MKKVLSLIVILSLVVILTGCSFVPRTTTNTATKIIEKTVDYGKNITKSAYLTKRNKLVIIAQNNNTVDVDITFEVEFYDSNNNLISSEKEYLSGVGAGAEVAVQIYDTPSSYYKYEIYADTEKSTYSKTYFNDIELTHNRGENVVAQAKNNSNETIDYITAAVVYYQGTTVVGYDSESAYDVKPGRSGNFNFYEPYDSSYDEVTYDSYKIFINEAYSYSY